MTISTISWGNSSKYILSKKYIIKRLNFQFFFGIIQKIFYEIINKNTPWLTAKSIKFINSVIKTTDTILEFGSGQSTLWFQKKCKKLYSVEHDPNWYKIIRKKLKKNKNTEYFLAEKKNKYLRIIGKIANNSINICLIDGNWRRDCLLHVFKKIKRGGLIILDNAETWLPTDYPSNSFQKTWQQRGSPEKNKTVKIIKELSGWKKIITSDVSQDTIIYIKK